MFSRVQSRATSRVFASKITRKLTTTTTTTTNTLFNPSIVPKYVKIVEVGPRDGLQNEPKLVSTDNKVKLIELLSLAGLPVVEATSFVSPKWVPQMGDAKDVMARLAPLINKNTQNQNQNQKPHQNQNQKSHQSKTTSYPVLTPNMVGYDAAVKSGAREVAVFASATEAFALKNTGRGILQNAKIHSEVVRAALADGVRVRGYVSCVLGCPYDGHVTPDQVCRAVSLLLEMGCYEISLGDTIGVGNPLSTSQLLDALARTHGTSILHTQMAVHFHNTHGTALANIATSLQHGVGVVDSSVAGLGGCPYARGATGNVPTEDVVYLLHGMGIETGVDVAALCEASRFICDVLGKPSRSLAGTQMCAKLMESRAHERSATA